VKRPPKRAFLAAAPFLAAAVIAGGCASGGREVDTRGAQLFAERCAGCHTLKAAGTQGSISGERPTGPNLDKRHLSKDEALFANRNGGFSGAIRPQNVVVGKVAEAVAEFLEKYAGSEAKSPPAPSSSGKE
jgi:mono/diheme cytochrome c family protein